MSDVLLDAAREEVRRLYGSPDDARAGVLVLPDGALDSPGRQAALADAFAGVPSGGLLVVAAYVVTATGGPANPSTSDLVRDVQAATGTAVDLAELRSVRLPGERVTRGVVMALRSLRN